MPEIPGRQHPGRNAERRRRQPGIQRQRLAAVKACPQALNQRRQQRRCSDQDVEQQHLQQLRPVILQHLVLEPPEHRQRHQGRQHECHRTGLNGSEPNRSNEDHQDTQGLHQQIGAGRQVDAPDGHQQVGSQSVDGCECACGAEDRDQRRRRMPLAPKKQVDDFDGIAGDQAMEGPAEQGHDRNAPQITLLQVHAVAVRLRECRQRDVAHRGHQIAVEQIHQSLSAAQERDGMEAQHLADDEIVGIHRDRRDAADQRAPSAKAQHLTPAGQGQPRQSVAGLCQPCAHTGGRIGRQRAQGQTRLTHAQSRQADGGCAAQCRRDKRDVQQPLELHLTPQQ
mmetsp:Transcript_39186/g.92064  ORF Transcript_39186/g.92064 Transcript_39186/m.92064 type:complete len:338 (-) Transcript_39186:5569-6582(-)